MSSGVLMVRGEEVAVSVRGAVSSSMPSPTLRVLLFARCPPDLCRSDHPSPHERGDDRQCPRVGLDSDGDRGVCDVPQNFSATTAADSDHDGRSPLPGKLAEPTANAPDLQIMDVLARTQNECLSELGYYPALLSEFQELRETCAKLHSDNQKLYSDNRSLAHFIAQQNQRMVLLQATDQQKRTIADLHESVRMVTNQRDEIQARLHAVYVMP